jgi:hypothetical protein
MRIWGNKISNSLFIIIKEFNNLIFKLTEYNAVNIKDPNSA